MNWSRFLVFILGAMVACRLGYAQSADAALLIVQFEGFDVGVLEPPGWHGDRNARGVVFRRAKEAPDQASTVIQFQVEKKEDRRAVEAFARHTKGHEENFTNIESTDLDVSHPAYGSTAKLFQVPAKFYEYVVYVNPKRRGSHLLLVAMKTGDHPATAEDLAALSLVVRSLVML